MSLSCDHTISPNTTKIGGQQAQGKHETALLASKVPFWEGASKGIFTICDAHKLCSAENIIFIVFSAKHSLQKKKKVSVEKKLPKSGGCKKVFFVCGFGFSVL